VLSLLVGGLKENFIWVDYNSKVAIRENKKYKTL
jgi:hypothetical protein